MVIGHHPHWIQTTEKYQGKYIFYSLGNFIFDQMWSQDTKEGLALKITISKTPTPSLQGTPIPARLETIELVPVIIENYSTPRLANEVESLKILKKIELETKILKP
jgi:poly-gamma-glutamate synthesis protein (capsule biosynthesis protein)